MLNDIICRVHKKLKFWRAAERQMAKPKFKELWALSTETDRKRFEDILQGEDLNKLHEWVYNQDLKRKPLEDWPVTQLREMARDMHIPDWHSLLKGQLLWEIEDHLHGHETEDGRPEDGGATLAEARCAPPNDRPDCDGTSRNLEEEGNFDG